jgi:uncharacterized membrane protein
MSISYAKDKQTMSAKAKVGVACAAGVLAFATMMHLGSWKIAPLLGWDVMAIVYLLWTWLTILPMGHELTQRFALREDPSRAASDVVLLGASIFSLAAVGLVLFASSGGSGELIKPVQGALSVISVVLSWLVVHTLFTLRYAELYYGEPAGGIDFGHDVPSYKDFAYLAFTVGMTFQVSDTNVSVSPIRHTILRHALLSYLFGTVILAATINLVAGLGT